MKNYAKELRIYIAIVILLVFAIVFHALYRFRFSPEYFIYIGAALVVCLNALKAGTITGLVTSILAIIVYGATYFYFAIKYNAFFDITLSQSLWLGLYLFLAILTGKIGDIINFYSNIHKKYPQELKDLVQDFSFKIVPQKTFNILIEEEMARSRRMKSCFSLVVISIQDITEIARVFGPNGMYEVVNKVKLYLRAILRENDNVTKLNNTTFEVILSGLCPSEITERFSHLENQLENAYLDHKGTVIKFPIKILIGSSTFPQDGEDIYALKNKAEQNLSSLKCELKPVNKI